MLIDWSSALIYIANGETEEHLEMLGGGVIKQLLDEKWKTFTRVSGGRGVDGVGGRKGEGNLHTGEWGRGVGRSGGRKGEGNLHTGEWRERCGGEEGVGVGRERGTFTWVSGGEVWM